MLLASELISLAKREQPGSMFATVDFDKLAYAALGAEMKQWLATEDGQKQFVAVVEDIKRVTEEQRRARQIPVLLDCCGGGIWGPGLLVRY